MTLTNIMIVLSALVIAWFIGVIATIFVLYWVAKKAKEKEL